MSGVMCALLDITTLLPNLLVGIPNKCIHRLQLIQNSSARIITPLESTEHWLPVAQGINFNMLLLTFKALHNQTYFRLTLPLALCGLHEQVYGTTTHQAQHSEGQDLLLCCTQALELTSPSHLHTGLHHRIQSCKFKVPLLALIFDEKKSDLKMARM